MRNAIAGGMIAGLIFGFVVAASADWRLAIPGCVLAGGLIGWAAGMLRGVLKRHMIVALPLEEGEVLLKEDPANHFLGIEAVSGWLYLTNRRLEFRSHALNIQVHEWWMPLGELVEVKPAWVAPIAPNGPYITSRLGTRDKFVVEGRNAWAAAIKGAMARACIAASTESQASPGQPN